MQTVIQVENLQKKYLIGHESTEKYTALRDVITRKVKSLFQPSTKSNNANIEEFYALTDVSFEIKQGERVGILGKNGAGKSTLLKILSRITEPTSGKISLKGRVSSLLEVGTGFHSELTGRENIFLNGAILGMSRLEIKKKFDEIVNFSEVEKFLDTPVKRYSSGMYVRLAFAVAAHLEPEILIVDEVLAVGDAEFQRKCLGKMEDVSKNEGRTVLFVSHNTHAIKALCSKGIVLNKGKVEYIGNVNESIDKYDTKIYLEKNNGYSIGRFDLKNHPNKKYDKNYGMTEARVYCDGKLSETMYPGCLLKIEVDIHNKNIIKNYLFGFVIKNSSDKEVIGINNSHLGEILKSPDNQTFTISYELILPLYGDENLTVDLYLGDGIEDYDILLEAISFKLEPRDVYNTSKLLNARFNQVYVPDIKVELNEINSKITI